MKQTVLLAKVQGHEAGIAEYVIGAIIALSRNFERVTSHLREGRWESQWAPGVPPPPVWPELAGRTLGSGLRGHRPGDRPSRPRL